MTFEHPSETHISAFLAFFSELCTQSSFSSIFKCVGPIERNFFLVLTIDHMYYVSLDFEFGNILKS